MVTGIISVFLAVLPMGIAFAGGTPLQGSLGWGLSIINGGGTDSQNEETVSDNETTQNMTMEEMAANLYGNTQSGDATAGQSENASAETEMKKPSLTDKVREISEKIINVWNMMVQRIRGFIINSTEQWPRYV